MKAHETLTRRDCDAGANFTDRLSENELDSRLVIVPQFPESENGNRSVIYADFDKKFFRSLDTTPAITEQVSTVNFSANP